MSPLRGGPSVMVRTMAAGLAQAGHQVDIAATDDDGPGHLDVPLGRPLREGAITCWYFRRQTRFYTASWPLTRWLARHIADYDVVHIHALFSYASLPAAWFAARRGVPYIVRPLGTLERLGMQQHKPWLKRISFPLVERRMLARAAAVHFTSERERAEAAELGVRERCVTLAMGIDLGKFAQLPAPGWLAARAPHLAGRTVVLFLSRLDPKKGLDLLLPAFAELRQREPNVALVLAGGGEPQFVFGLKQMAARLGIADDLYWAGFLEGDEKLAALAAADMFVLPSYSENFGVAAVEALACGLPVLVSDQVGIHQEIAAAGAGIVVPTRVKPLAEGMARLCADPALRRTMARAARLLAAERFSLPSMTAGLLRMYADAMVERSNVLTF
jgi:glycosyltransferase involved in cell wall biosynthesis